VLRPQDPTSRLRYESAAQFRCVQRGAFSILSGPLRVRARGMLPYRAVRPLLVHQSRWRKIDTGTGPKPDYFGRWCRVSGLNQALAAHGDTDWVRFPAVVEGFTSPESGSTRSITGARESELAADERLDPLEAHLGARRKSPVQYLKPPRATWVGHRSGRFRKRTHCRLGPDSTCRASTQKT
jgi:hypothetical protein